MKNVRLLVLLFVAIILGSSSPMHATGEPDSPEEQLRNKIVRLAENTDLRRVDYHDWEASVEFLVTHENKLVVLTIDTHSPVLEQQLMNKLNYKRINIDGVQRMIPYTIELSFITSNNKTKR